MMGVHGSNHLPIGMALEGFNEYRLIASPRRILKVVHV